MFTEVPSWSGIDGGVVKSGFHVKESFLFHAEGMADLICNSSRKVAVVPNFSLSSSCEEKRHSVS